MRLLFFSLPSTEALQGTACFNLSQPGFYASIRSMLTYSPFLPIETPRGESDLQSWFSEWEAELPPLDALTAPARPLVDVTAVAREVGLLPPTALTAALWSAITAIPPGFGPEETVQARLWNVLRHACFAVLYQQPPDNANEVKDELLVFSVCLPAVGQEISDYPVALLFRCRASGGPTLTLMTPEEAVSVIT